MVYGFGFRVHVSGSRVQLVGFGVQILGFRVQGTRFGVQGSECEVDLGCWVGPGCAHGGVVVAGGRAMVAHDVAHLRCHLFMV